MAAAGIHAGSRLSMAVSSEEQERVRSDLRRYLERLRSSDMRTRDQASDALSDFFEYDIGNSYKIDRGRLAAFQHEICEAMEALIDLAVREQNAIVIESALHALVCVAAFVTMFVLHGQTTQRYLYGGRSFDHPVGNHEQCRRYGPVHRRACDGGPSERGHPLATPSHPATTASPNSR
jgi:hypothetical protein